jgi:hypothetical protein
MAVDLPSRPPPILSPPAPWPLSSPPPPLRSPRARPWLNRTFVTLGAILVVVCAGVVGLFVFLNPGLSTDCPPFYASCPGNTPLGTAFEFGNATSAKVSAGSVAQPGCSPPVAGKEYCEVVGIAYATGGISTQSIHFQLQTGNASMVPFDSVTLVDSQGLGMAQLSAGGVWRLCTPANCGSGPSPLASSLPVNLLTSYELVLNAGPSATFPNGLTSFDLIAIGSGSFSGTVAAALT